MENRLEVGPKLRESTLSMSPIVVSLPYEVLFCAIQRGLLHGVRRELLILLDLACRDGSSYLGEDGLSIQRVRLQDRSLWWRSSDVVSFVRIENLHEDMAFQNVVDLTKRLAISSTGTESGGQGATVRYIFSCLHIGSQADVTVLTTLLKLAEFTLIAGGQDSYDSRSASCSCR